MKLKKTHSEKRNEIAELLRRVQEYKPARGDFNYAERGRAVAEAHQLYNEAFQLGKAFPVDSDLAAARTEAIRLWYTAIDHAYLPGFWHFFKELRAGSPSGLESVVSFLEADPVFFRTGYLKTKIIRYMKQPMLTAHYGKRLQQVVLAVVDKRDDRDFRAFCRLAKKVDTPELREQLKQRLTYADADIRRRARWVLEALEQKDRMEKSS